MRRRSGLRARTALVRKNPLIARLRPAVTRDVRGALVDRSAGVCEMALPGCTTWATDAAHRISRKTGGRRGSARARLDALSNVLHACRSCHEWCHSRPEDAYEIGLALREYSNPATEPVLYRGRMAYLDNLGMFYDYERPLAEITGGGSDE